MWIANYRARGGRAARLLALAWGCCVEAAGPPPTAVVPVEETYHGVVVTDPYRWLEEASNASVQEWVAAQARYAREHLDALPGGEEIRAEVTAILKAPVVSYSGVCAAGGRVFALKRQPPRQQPFLVVMPSVDRPEEARVLVDPERLDPAGSVAIDWYVPAPDGATVAVSLSRDGTEAGDLHLFDVAAGAVTGEMVPGVNGGTAGGSLAWAPAGDGFFYTRYPRPGERPPEDAAFFVQVFYHRLGTDPAEDRYEIGADFPRIAEIELKAGPGSAHLLATVQDGDGGRFAHFLRSPDGAWRQLAGFDDGIQQIEFGAEGELYLVSRRDAPRGKLLRLPLSRPDSSAAELVLPQGEETLVSTFWGAPSVLVTGGRILATYQLGGPSEIRSFDRAGARVPGPEQGAVSSVGGLAEIEPGVVLFARGSYLEPPACYRFDTATGTTRPTALRTDAPVRFDDCELAREFAVSRDGTRVPVNILRRRGLVLDGSHPCLVTGYGGYGVSQTPSCQPLDRILLDRGFVVAEANLRGGGEYGEEWHRAGNLTRKQNVFDDFIAVLEHMIARGYTRPERLGIIGGSNGGLLMGAVLTQRPDLMRAVVSAVGIYDMLRVELSPNGAFNVTEFGTVKDSEQFRALHAYSPYHRVARGVEYPAVLMLAGANDPRVDPMQSRKMTAALQAAAAGRAPVLLRMSAGTGHGGDTPLDERVEERVDVYRFLFAQLGIPAEESAREVCEIGTRRELMVDDFLIERMTGAELRLHPPTPREVALAFDRAWEGNVSAYVTVFADAAGFRMYYRGADYDWSQDRVTHEFTCCAVSADGVEWTRPELGLFEFEGSGANNIVWHGAGTHNFTPFRDSNPECPPESRYKALASGEGGLLAFASADGFRWIPVQEQPVITKGAFDSQNLAFWDAARKRYVEFHRGGRDGVRDILTSTSADFVHWTDPQWLDYGAAPREHLYTNAIIPCDRAPHIFLGFPKRFVPDRKKIDEHPSPGLSDGLFMTSRDGVHWNRWPEAWIRPGPQPDRWWQRNNMTAWGVLQTRSALPDAPDELSVYSSEHYYVEGCRLRRFTLRLDGFVSACAPRAGGELLTRPLRFSGSRLRLNYATSAAGSVVVEIQDAAGRPVPGFEAASCRPLFGDEIEGEVRWEGDPDLSRLAGRAVRLRIALIDADLYALSFGL